MANPHKLKVGQKLFIRDFDRYSSKIEESIIEVTITKLGNKYFEVREEDSSMDWKWKGQKFFNESLELQVSYGYSTMTAFKTLQVLEEVKERIIKEDILNKFYYDRKIKFLSLDQIRRIVSIIQEV